MNALSVFQELIDKALFDRAMSNDHAIKLAIERGDPKWMPGALVKALDEERRAVLAGLTMEDTITRRVDPWQIPEQPTMREVMQREAERARGK